MRAVPVEVVIAVAGTRLVDQVGANASGVAERKHPQIVMQRGHEIGVRSPNKIGLRQTRQDQTAEEPVLAAWRRVVDAFDGQRAIDGNWRREIHDAGEIVWVRERRWVFLEQPVRSAAGMEKVLQGRPGEHKRERAWA